MQQGQPNLAGVDFNRYQEWRVVRTPSGGTYYAVPGTGFVYDPFMSAARGKPVLWQNPEPTQQEQQKAEEERQRQIRAQEEASSPQGQLIPVVGGVAGTVGGAYAIREITKDPSTGKEVVEALTQPTATAPQSGPVVQPTAPQTVAPANPGDAFVQGAMGPQTPTAPNSMTPVGDAVVVQPGQAVPDGYTAIGAAADGSGAQVAVPADQVAADGSVNFGGMAQGALGAFQLYQGYRSYKEGDYVGAGMNTAGGTVSIGAALGSPWAAAAAPYVGPVVGAYTGYKTLDAVSDMPQGSERNKTGATGGAASGAAIGSAFGPMGTVIGAGIGTVLGLGASLTGSGKDKYQFMRDKGRDYLQENGILDENYQGTLADGSTFDFGKDGKTHGKGKFDHKYYDKAAAYGNVLATIEGADGKGREAMATLYGNAAVSNADDPNTVVDNFRHFASQRGITYDVVRQRLAEAKEKGHITDHEYEVYLNDAREFIPPGAPPQPGQPQQPQTKGAGVATRAPGVPIPPPRSSTISAGIGLDGQRIAYGKELAGRINRRGR